MHIHHFTLLRIADVIRKRVLGGILVEAFSQDKDQVVLGIGTPDDELWIRVACGAPLPHIWPVSKFAKAKKNVFDLFEPLRGRKLIDVSVQKWDRVMFLTFEGKYQLVLKMHGLSSNVILRHKAENVQIFRTSVETDFEFQPGPGEFDYDWESKSEDYADLPVKDRLRKISPLLDKNFEARVSLLMERGKSFVEALHSSLKEAESGDFYLLNDPKKIRFLLFDPEDESAIPFSDPLEALNVFFRSWFQYHAYARHYRDVDRLLKKHLKRYRGQLNSFYESIETIENARPPEEIGHIIMANLHAIPPNVKKVELFDFYQDSQITIKLKPELNAQSNAERFYQKSKKHKSRIKHLEIQIERLEEEVASFDEVEKGFKELLPPLKLELKERGFDYSHNKAMQAFVKQHMKLLKAGKPYLAEKKHPFQEFRRGGYTILVGKNAKQNDELTFRFSKKEDLWLHVRDAQGSHVVVRKSNQNEVPNEVLEYAASLAAFYSKRKREQLVPVQYTERKYVRKVRQGHPGQVIVTREKVVMVEPWDAPGN